MINLIHVAFSPSLQTELLLKRLNPYGSVNTQTYWEEKVNPVKLCFLLHNGPAGALLQSYWAISVRGSRAWSRQIKAALMK